MRWSGLVVRPKDTSIMVLDGGIKGFSHRVYCAPFVLFVKFG